MRIDETVTDQDLESVAGGWCATPVPPPPCWPPRLPPVFPPRPIPCPGPLPIGPIPWDPPVVTFGGAGVGLDDTDA
jgi:hypothetical protein